MIQRDSESILLILASLLVNTLSASVRIKGIKRMNKKLYWGLGVLSLLICLVFFFMTLRNRAEIRQLKQEAPALAQEQHVPQQSIVNNKPSQEASPGYKWEWHEDHWYQMPVAHNDEEAEGATFVDMSDAEISVIEAEYWASKGVKSPPPGHTYCRINGGKLRLIRMNTPIIEVTWTETYGDMHQLSLEEFERYKALLAIASQVLLVIEEDDLEAHAAGTLDLTDKEQFPDDVAALAREWADEIYKKTLGPSPSVNIYGSWNRPRTAEDEALKRQFIEEALAPHKRVPREPKSVDHKLIESILIELKASL